MQRDYVCEIANFEKIRNHTETVHCSAYVGGNQIIFSFIVFCYGNLSVSFYIECSARIMD